MVDDIEDIATFVPRVRRDEAPTKLDGRAVADQLLDYLAGEVEQLKQRGVEPKLSVVLAEGDEAGEIYVKHKVKACEQIGVESDVRKIPSDMSQSALHRLVRDLNSDKSVDGMLLQLPLPDQIISEEALEIVAPAKDVDGIHPLNLGRLMSGAARLEPCTPRGIMTLLEAYDVDPDGKEAVVIGRSRIVGRPMAQMLLRANATVTVCHRHTSDLRKHINRAEILVVATGVPNLVHGDWIKEGAVVVDVGITRRENGRLVGDVEYKKAKQRASLITPVPGGVGPMTVASLMQNTIVAAARRIEYGEESKR